MRKCALLLAVLSLAFAPAPFPRTVKKPPAVTMEGWWDQVGSPTVTLVVTPTTLTYHNKGGSPSAYGFRSDAIKSPPTYDLLDGRHVRYVGIYRVDGDRLVLHYRSADRPRPTSFEEGSVMIETFTRVK